MSDRSAIASDALATSRHVLQSAVPSAEFGFDVATRSSSVGFAISKSILSSIAGVLGDTLGAPLHLAHGIVDGAEHVTHASIQTSRLITKASLNAADSALEAAGVETGTLEHISPHLHAFSCIASMITTYTNHLAPLTVQELASGLTNLSNLQEEAEIRTRLAEGFPWPYLTTDIVAHGPELESLVSLMSVCLAAYGDLACRALGAIALNETALAVLAPGLVLLHSKTQGDIYHPGYLLLSDEANSRILFVLRGTFRPGDVVTDLMCMREPLEESSGAFVHGGMLKAAIKVKEAVGDLLSSELKKRPGFSLVITGHSLGAGVATLLLAVLERDANFAPLKPTCFAFAPPCTVSSDFAALLPNVNARITSIVNEDDMVSRFGLSQMEDLRAAVLRLNRDPGVTYATLCQEEMGRLKLAPAGRILHLTHGHFERIVVRERPPTYFSYLLLTKSMFSAHMPQTYLQRMKNC